MGWMPKKLRGMCNIVDTSKQSPADQQQTMQDYAVNGGRKPKAPDLPQKITLEEFNKLPEAQRKMYEQEKPPEGSGLQGEDLMAAACDAMGDAGGGFDIGSAEMVDAMANFSDMLVSGLHVLLIN